MLILGEVFGKVVTRLFYFFPFINQGKGRRYCMYALFESISSLLPLSLQR